MASRKEYEMLFQLDAKLGSSYTSTFSKAKSGPSELQKEIRSLQSVQADISAYTKQQAAVEKTQAELDNLNKQYQLLQQEIKETCGPTTSLERESVKLEQRIGDTSNALATQKERLSQTAASLSAAGISTERLGEANADLSDRLSYLRTKQIAATKSAEEFGSVGVSSIESVAQAYASTKIYDALGKIKDAYIAAGEASIEYESAVTGVYKTVDGTDAQLAAIDDAIKDMATDIPATTEEIAGVAESAGQLGIATQDVMDFSRVMIDLGESTNLSAEQAATSLAKFSNITGTLPENYSRLGSVIVDLGNNFATTEADITEMGTRLASGGKLAGLTEPQILALSAAMSSVGIEAEAGGTAMTQTLSAIEKAVVNADESLSEYARIAGMSAEEFSNAWKNDALTALTSFISGLGELDSQGESATLVLDDLGLSGIRQSNMLKSLALAANTLTSAVNVANTAWDENVALTNEANKRYATTESRLGAAKNSFNNLKIAVGDVYTPVVREAADAGNEMLQGMTEFVEENPAVVKGVSVTVGVLGAAATGLTAYTAAAGIAKAATAALGATFTASLGPVALAVAGVSLAAGAIVTLVSASDDASNSLGEVPPKLSDITAEARGVTDSLEEAQSVMQESAETTMATAATADVYIKRLEEMGDYASLSAEQQREYSNILTLLCDLVPELSEHINAATGEIEGGVAALRGYASAWEEAAKAQAYQDYMSSAAEQYNAVTTELYGNQLKLTEAQTKAQSASKGMDDAYGKILKTLGLTNEEFIETYWSVDSLASHMMMDLPTDVIDSVLDLREQWISYREEKEQAEWVENTYQKAIEEGTAKQQEAQEAVENAQKAYEDLEAAQAAGSDSATQGAAELGDAIAVVKSNAEGLVSVYTEAYNSAYESIHGQYALWDEAADISATSVDKITQNLDNQASYWETYKSNLDTLLSKTGNVDGLSEMISSFADGSAESVDAIAGMAQAAQDGDGKLQAMVSSWQDLQQAQKDASETLADLSTDFTNKMQDVADKAAESIDNLDLSEEAAENGKATVQSYIDSATSLLPSVTAAYERIGAAATNALQNKVAAVSADSSPKSSNAPEQKTGSTSRVKTTGAQATGTRNADPGWTLVGEYGPEIVYMQGGEGVLNAAQTKDVLPALDDRYTDTRAENAEAPAPKETAQAAESAAVNPHEGIRNDTRAAQTPATTARVMPQTADGPAEAVSAPAVNQPKVGIPQEVEAAQEPVSAAVAADVPDTVSATEPFSGIPENGMQYAETVQAEDAYQASAAQPAAEAAAFAPAEADKVDIPLDGQTPENGLSAAEMNHAAEADAMLADYTAVISPRAVDAMGSFAAQNAKSAAEAVQAESAKSSTTTQLQPMSLSPVFQISGMQDSQQLRSALNQSVEDMRQMILDVVQSARDDEERMNFS